MIESNALIGYVYVFAAGYRWKIGYTTNWENRLATLQTACPDELIPLLVIPGTRNDESALHSKFARNRLRGEWFNPSDEMRAWVHENQLFSIARRGPKPTHVPLISVSRDGWLWHDKHYETRHEVVLDGRCWAIDSTLRELDHNGLELGRVGESRILVTYSRLTDLSAMVDDLDDASGDAQAAATVAAAFAADDPDVYNRLAYWESLQLVPEHRGRGWGYAFAACIYDFSSQVIGEARLLFGLPFPHSASEQQGRQRTDAIASLEEWLVGFGFQRGIGSVDDLPVLYHCTSSRWPKNSWMERYYWVR